MKKLNNKGWGLNTFIIFIFVFLFALIVISILALVVDKKDNIPLTHEEENSIFSEKQ